jgi:hypothetical protein
MRKSQMERKLRGESKTDGIAAGKVRRNTGKNTERDNESQFEEGDEIDEDEQSNEPDEISENFLDITMICHPCHIYPTTVLPRSRRTENALQPLLYIAAPHPTLPTLHCGVPLTCYGRIQQPLIRQRRDELDLISGDIEMGIGAPNLMNTEMERLITINDPDGVSSSSQLNTIIHTHKHNYATPTAKIQRQDGLYANQLPILADILMNAENVDSLPIAKLVDADVGLARVTQRTLRDLKGQVDNEKLRRIWTTLVRSNRGKEGRHNRDEDDVFILKKSLRTPFSSVSELLNQLSIGPVLRIIDDPVIDFPSQPVIPDTALSYGGVLGQWPEEISNEERLGHILYGGEGKGSTIRSLLRIHVHQLGLLEHPYVNEEERLFARLKECYQQYSSLIQQNTLGYLCTRLVGLILELSRLMNMSEEITLDEEEKKSVRLLYKDLVESLPSLCELHWAIGSLSSTLYMDWKELQETRRKQGFSSTTALLSVRKIEPKRSRGLGGKIEDDEDDVDDDIESPDKRLRKGRRKGREEKEKVKKLSLFDRKALKDDEEDSNDHGWTKLRGMLGSVNELLEKVQGLFLRYPSHKTHHLNPLRFTPVPYTLPPIP